MEKRLLRFSLILASCLLSCNSTQFAQQFVGDYQGKDSSGATFVASVSSQGSTSASVLALSSHQINQPTLVPAQGTLALTSANALSASFTGSITFNGSLTKNGNCFSGVSSNSTLELCPCKGGFTMSYTQAPSSAYTLTFTRATNDELSQLEPPQAYTSSQLRDLSANKSFQDRTEIEQVIQAKLTARVAYLNLLPHLNINSVLALSSYSGLLSEAGSIGDLAPFLLPDRWFQAKEQKDVYQSEILAELIMKLDTMQGVEGLAINLGRDNAIDAQLQVDIATMQKVAAQVQTLETAGKFPLGSAASINSTINIVAQTDSDLQSNIALEYTGLAQAVGFVNPNAISAVTVDSFGDINNPTDYILATLESQAVAESPEIQQLNSLYAAAQDIKNARAFQWLDPAGDDNGSIGAGLPSYLQIGQSGVREIAIQKDQTNSTILTEVTNNYNNYTGWIESYQLAEQGLAIQKQRLADDMTLLAAGGVGLEIAEIQDALTQQSVNDINLLTAQYAWYGNVSLFNRLLGSGAYQH